MPHYDYQCKKCGHRFEVFQKITDKPVFNCPKCNSAAKRLFSSGAGLIFKGNGFYATDYKNPKAGKSDSEATCNIDNPSCTKCPKKKE